MASFSRGSLRTPFGVNEYLRSTQDLKFDSRTVAASTVPEQTIDGHPSQKILQRGVVLATITSGPEAGKVGPFQAVGAAEVTTLTSSGTATSGTFTITALGVTTDDVAYNATAAEIMEAVNDALEAGDVDESSRVLSATGGPLNTTPVLLTWGVNLGDVDQPTVDGTDLVGSGHTITPTTSTAGTAGATDGRGVVANIVGINDTFLPWQLMERDVEVACLYEGTVDQARCIVLSAAGVETALDNTTAGSMDAEKHLKITFR